MKDMNKVFLLGRLGADPILRETKNGFPVANFPLATSRKIRSGGSDEAPEFSEETQWHRVVVWGNSGKACVNYLKKGAPVLVEGNIRSKKYDDKDGSTKWSFEIEADTVSFLGGPISRRERSPELVESLESA